jgi:hypothetical protein
MTEELPTVYEASHNSVTTREYLERICTERSKRVAERFNSMEELYAQRFEMQDNALLLATKDLEARLDKLNALRAEVLQDRSRYITLESYEARHSPVEARIKALELWQSKILGAGLAVAIVGGVSGSLVAKLLGL